MSSITSITLEEIHRLCQLDAIRWTDHVAKRMLKRQIFPEEVIDTLMQGIIIEDYPDDYPFPSCLVFAANVNGRPLHVVCSIGEEMLYIITAYQPDSTRWDASFQKRVKGDDPT